MSDRSGPLVLIAGATVALLCGLYGYAAPLTGVTGTGGALLASFGALCLALGGALLLRSPGRGARLALLVLLTLGLALTALATTLLHQWLMLAALGLCALGWLLCLRPTRGGRA
jgi:hypothetical protein